MAVGVNIVSSFDSKGIRKALNDFQKLEGAGNKATFGLRHFLRFLNQQRRCNACFYSKERYSPMRRLRI